MKLQKLRCPSRCHDKRGVNWEETIPISLMRRQKLGNFSLYERFDINELEGEKNRKNLF